MSENSPEPTSPTDKPSSPAHKPPKKKPTYKEKYPPSAPHETKVDTSGRMHQFGPMQFTDKQWKRFIKQLEQSISEEIKKQQKRMKKAQEQLKRSIEGKPL